MIKTAQTLLKFGILSSALMAMFSVTHANENSDRRLISIQAEAVREVANDEMQATLYTELNEKDAATLANKINISINQALQLAKKYPNVKVQTGSQNTYPVYNDKNQLTNWRGRATVILNSQDFKQTSELIAQLQNTLKLQGIGFNVSEAQRNKVENELHVEASRAFQQRAQLLLAPWNATRYELVNLQLNASGRFAQPMYADAAMATFRSAKVESQNIEAGNSEVRVSANGTIQLQ